MWHWTFTKQIWSAVTKLKKIFFSSSKNAYVNEEDTAEFVNWCGNLVSNLKKKTIHFKSMYTNEPINSHTTSSGASSISQKVRGAPNPRWGPQAYYLAKLFQKIKKQIWPISRGRASLVSPVSASINTIKSFPSVLLRICRFFRCRLRRRTCDGIVSRFVFFLISP